MIYNKFQNGGGTKLICVADKVSVNIHDCYTETSHKGATKIIKYCYDYDISSQIAKYPNLTLDNILISKNWLSNSDGPTGLHPAYTIPWSSRGTVPYDGYAYSEPILQGVSNGKIKICTWWDSTFGDQQYHNGIGRFSIYIYPLRQG